MVAALTWTPTATGLDDARPDGWSRIDLGGGDEVFVRPGGPELLVFFSGGGAAWDAHTAARPFSLGTLVGAAFGGEPGYYFDSVPFFKPATLGGMLATSAEAGIFADWTVVYVPYTTGDFHVGDAVVDYGDGVVGRYEGSRSARAALDWVYASVPDAETVMVAGESAGGFGAAFWLSDVAEHYPDARLIQYSDGSFIPSDRWPEIYDDVWQARTEERFGIVVVDDPIAAAVRANVERYGDRLTVLQSQTRHDGTLTWFTGKLNGDDGAGWGAAMCASMSDLAGIAGVDVFVTATGADDSGATPHTLSTGSSYLEEREDGVSLRDWIEDAVAGRPSTIGVDAGGCTVD